MKINQEGAILHYALFYKSKYFKKYYLKKLEYSVLVHNSICKEKIT